MSRSHALPIAASAGMLVALLLPWRASANVASQLDYFRESEAAHCPDETKLRQAISSRLGYDPFIEWSPRRVVAEIAVSGTRLTAIIRLVEGGGIVQNRSELSADRDECAELIAAVALAIAIHLDPDSASRASRAEPTQSDQATAAAETDKPEAPVVAPTPITPPEASPPERKTPISAPNPTTPLSAAIRLGAAMLNGQQPHTTLALKAGGVLDYGAFRVATEVLADLPASVQNARGGIRSHALSAALLPCAVYRWLAGCAEVMADAVWAQGVDVAVSERTTLWNLAVGARLEATWELNRTWAGVVDLDLLRNLTPTSLRLQQVSVWQSPAYRYALGLAVEMRFP